jgi:hypothetical protein
MRLRYRLLLLAGCLAAAAACSQKPQQASPPEPGSLRPEAAHGSAVTGSAIPDKGLIFTVPPGWIVEPPASSNRKAQYRLPRMRGDAEDGEVVVYHFQGEGGTTKDNVDRWIGQFAGPDGKSAANTAITVQTSVDGIPLTVVDVGGTYTGSMASMRQSENPKEHFRMLAAIAEAGNGPWFFKFTGPEKTVARWESSFQSFLNSIKQAK